MAGILLVKEARGRVTDYTGAANPQRQDRVRYVGSNGLIHDTKLGLLRSA